MKEHSENDFKSKFGLLNSQENSEDIIWSCSDSSDYEESIGNENLRKANAAISRKRKRAKTRKRALRNISNLDVTFVERSKSNQKHDGRSPIISKHIPSPILDKSHVLSSPILSCYNKKITCTESRNIKSPILTLKHASPKVSPTIRLKLFENDSSTTNQLKSKKNTRSKSPVSSVQFYKNTRVNEIKTVHNAAETNFELCDNLNRDIKLEVLDFDCSYQNVSDTKTEISNVVSEQVKEYFNGHFSSVTPSQQSISEYDTTPRNSSKTSEEIEIFNSQNEKKVLPQIIKLDKGSSSDSLKSYELLEKPKKVRYKKNGLAYRLSVLLKKQKAATSLWQHERFLAANSTFVLPSDNFTLFRIQNVTFNYGCYLIDLKDEKNLRHFVLINSLCVNISNLEQWNIFKLYQPFKILDFNSDYKLIVNVSKFECTVLDC